MAVGLVEKVKEFHIVQASLEDLGSILVIEKDSFSVPWSQKAFEAELVGNEFSTTMVARDGTLHEGRGPILAYYCIWVVFEELRFLTLAVHPAFRRQNIGSRLVVHALHLGVSKGTRRALLEVRESNQAARSLYEKFGFQHYGTRKSYYTNPDEDAILMTLDPLLVSAE